MSAIWESANWTRQFGMLPSKHHPSQHVVASYIHDMQIHQSQDIRWISPADNHDFCQEE
jgi:hypothetical protein